MRKSTYTIQTTKKARNSLRACKRFHDRARAGKLNSGQGLFWCAMQRIVPEPVKVFMIGREQAN
jgi:hypothetical protein